MFGSVGMGKEAEEVKALFSTQLCFLLCFCFRDSDCSVVLLLVVSEHKTCQLRLTPSNVLCSLLGVKMNVSLMP